MHGPIEFPSKHFNQNDLNICMQMKIKNIFHASSHQSKLEIYIHHLWCDPWTWFWINFKYVWENMTPKRLLIWNDSCEIDGFIKIVNWCCLELNRLLLNIGHYYWQLECVLLTKWNIYYIWSICLPISRWIDILIKYGVVRLIRTEFSFSVNITNIKSKCLFITLTDVTLLLQIYAKMCFNQANFQMYTYISP